MRSRKAHVIVNAVAAMAVVFLATPIPHYPTLIEPETSHPMPAPLSEVTKPAASSESAPMLDFQGIAQSGSDALNVLCGKALRLKATLQTYANTAPLNTAPLADAPATLEPEPKPQPVKPAGSPNLSALVNFAKVDSLLYRGAQPSDEGLRALKNIGVRTIVSLRTHAEGSQSASALGLAYYHVPMHQWNPSDEDVVEWLRIVVEQQKKGPVFVHCRQGADRTGMMVAVYRVVVTGWTKEVALAEMTGGGFNNHSFWKSLRKYIARMDVDSIRRQAGLTQPAPVLAAAERSPANNDEPRVILVAATLGAAPIMEASSKQAPAPTTPSDTHSNTPDDHQDNGAVRVVKHVPSATLHGLKKVGGFVSDLTHHRH